MTEDDSYRLIKSHKLRAAMASKCGACGALPGLKCTRLFSRNNTTYIEILDQPHEVRIRDARGPQA